MTYQKNPALNLYLRCGFEGIAYSDGQEIELRLLELIGSASDRSVFSSEIAHGITDWASEYHLCRQRHCLLRPIDIKKGDKVLELGCGCGAITRYLGELGAQVTAVEGSVTRARIAALRCADLPNVTVIADNLVDYQSNECFDWVLLIGVLEYAPVFIGEREPAHHYLQSVTRHLSPSGRLVVAIENKLGLKYFNGCGEDHIGKPFFGVQGLYGPKQPATYGRRELRELLQAAGFNYIEFLYPFPDYKLPRVILTDKGLTDEKFAPAELLATVFARDYASSQSLQFNEALVNRQLAGNGMLSDLSNSFLCVAAARPLQSVAPTLLGAVYSVGREARFAASTQVRELSNELIVEKQRLHSDCENTILFQGMPLRQLATATKYVQGTLLIWDIIQAYVKDSGLDSMTQAFMPWFDLLLARARIAESDLGDATISGHLLDLTPSNVINTGEHLHIIDQEFQLDTDVALEWIFVRGIYYSIIHLPNKNSHAEIVEELATRLCQARGYSLKPGFMMRFAEQESALQSAITGAHYKVILCPTINAPQQDKSNSASAILAAARRIRAKISRQLACRH